MAGMSSAKIFSDLLNPLKALDYRENADIKIDLIRVPEKSIGSIRTNKAVDLVHIG